MATRVTVVSVAAFAVVATASVANAQGGPSPRNGACFYEDTNYRGRSFCVESGDSLWEIANYFHISLKHLLSANPQIKNPDIIHPGDTLTIRLTLERRDGEQRLITRTVETAIGLRN